MTHLIKSWNNRAIRIREDRYVSLTDMANATGKRFPDWNRLDGTKSYLATLSTVVQIPTTTLIDIVQGGNAEMQGTWGHPKVALRFAQWCSDEFAVQVDCWIDELITTGSVHLVPQPQQLTFDAQVRLEADLLQQVLSTSDLHCNIVSGVLLNFAGSRLPALKGAVNEAHGLLAAATPSPLLLSPTAIGERLGVSARQVNLLLLDLGYQIKNLSKKSKDEPSYLPTDIGRAYASNTLATGRLLEGGTDNTSYQHLKWKSEVVEILRELLVEV